jgi:hypothetical protein
MVLKERTETTLTTQVGAHTSNSQPHQHNDLVRRLHHVLVIIKVVYTTPLSFRVINMSYMTLCDVLLKEMTEKTLTTQLGPEPKTF